MPYININKVKQKQKILANKITATYIMEKHQYKNKYSNIKRKKGKKLEANLRSKVWRSGGREKSVRQQGRERAARIWLGKGKYATRKGKEKTWNKASLKSNLTNATTIWLGKGESVAGNGEEKP